MICNNYDKVVKELNGAKLLVVSKTQSVEDIKTLYDHGVLSFGENRIEELKSKVELLPSDIDWHFIGRIQTKKIRNIVKCASLIHSVDSMKTLETIDLEANKINKVQDVLIQLNVSNEETKTGFLGDDLASVMEVAKELKFVRVVGLMTMAPFTDDEEILTAVFSKMRQLFDLYDFHVLSMGMSNDYKLAVENGSTLVRIGTKVFSK